VRIRRETVRTPLVATRYRILFASDLHLVLPWTRRVASGLIAAANAERPDVVLLGGDLVDHSGGFDALGPCVAELARGRPVAAVAGNHDVGAGVAEVRARVVEAGGRWLGDEPMVARSDDGSAIRFSGGTTTDRLSDSELNVACLHHPADAVEVSRAGFDVAFAGHLHGGQCVLFERRGRLYPGAWFSPWTGLRFQVGSLSLFVSLGLGDTIPLRLNCPHEVIVCDMRPAPRARAAPSRVD
jgi:uncharacterized protein